MRDEKTKITNHYFNIVFDYGLIQTYPNRYFELLYTVRHNIKGDVSGVRTKHRIKSRGELFTKLIKVKFGYSSRVLLFTYGCFL